MNSKVALIWQPLRLVHLFSRVQSLVEETKFADLSLGKGARWKTSLINDPSFICQVIGRQDIPCQRSIKLRSNLVN